MVLNVDPRHIISDVGIDKRRRCVGVRNGSPPGDEGARSGVETEPDDLFLEAQRSLDSRAEVVIVSGAREQSVECPFAVVAADKTGCVHSCRGRGRCSPPTMRQRTPAKCQRKPSVSSLSPQPLCSFHHGMTSVSWTSVSYPANVLSAEKLERNEYCAEIKADRSALTCASASRRSAVEAAPSLYDSKTLS